MSEEPKSISEEICDQIREVGFLPIPFRSIIDDETIPRYFTGELSDFFKAAKVLGAGGIFIETLYLEEDEFYYDSGFENEEDTEDEKQSDDDEKAEESDDIENLVDPVDLNGVDLSLLHPEIADYQSRIGESCGVRLVIPGADNLETEIFADWYNEFIDFIDDASDQIETDPSGVIEKIKKYAEK